MNPNYIRQSLRTYPNTQFHHTNTYDLSTALSVQPQRTHTMDSRHIWNSAV